MPELFAGSAAKYDTSNFRKFMLTNTMVPNLGTLWNGAVQTSTIHPQKLLDAKRKHGIPIDGDTHMQEYFVIPVERLLKDPKVKKMVHWNFPEDRTRIMMGLVLNNQYLRGMLGEWNKQDFPLLDQNYLDSTFENLTELTPHADEFYRQWGEQFSRGETPQVLTYKGMPHVFIDGEIDIDGLEIIETK